MQSASRQGHSSTASPSRGARHDKPMSLEANFEQSFSVKVTTPLVRQIVRGVDRDSATSVARRFSCQATPTGGEEF